MNKPQHVYTAARQTRRSGTVVRAMVTNLLNTHYVAFRLAERDIKGQYSRSALGMLWDFLDPLVLATVFYFLRRFDVFSTGDLAMPYSLYVIYGLLLYQSFMEGTLWSADVAYRFRALLTQQKVTPEALLVSTFFRCMFFSSFRILVMLLFTFAVGQFSVIGLVLFVLAYPAIILAGMAIGTLLAPLNTIYPDVGRFLRLVFVPLRFLSPVIFIIPDKTIFLALNSVNPLATILPNLRAMAINGVWVDPQLAALHSGVLLAIGLTGWYFFHVTLPVLSEKV